MVVAALHTHHLPHQCQQQALWRHSRERIVPMLQRCCSAQKETSLVEDKGLRAQTRDAVLPLGKAALSTVQYAWFSQVIGTSAVAAACLSSGVDNPAALDANTTAVYVITADAANLVLASHIAKSVLQEAQIQPWDYLQQAKAAVSSSTAACVAGGVAACIAASILTTTLTERLSTPLGGASSAAEDILATANDALGAVAVLDAVSPLQAAAAGGDPSTLAFWVLACSLVIVGPLSEEIVFRGLLTGSLSRQWSQTAQPEDMQAVHIRSSTAASASAHADMHGCVPVSTDRQSEGIGSGSLVSSPVQPGRVYAIVVGALTFAAYHLDADNFLALVLIGVALGGVYEATGRNLLASWSAHALYNAAVLVAQQLP